MQSARLRFARARALLISILDFCSAVRLEGGGLALIEEGFEAAEIGDLAVRVPGGEEERVLRRFEGLKISTRVFDEEEEAIAFVAFGERIDRFSWREWMNGEVVLGILAGKCNIIRCNKLCRS